MLSQWIGQPGGLEWVFWLCAIAGTLFFIVRSAMALTLGDAGEGDGSSGFELDGDGATGVSLNDQAMASESFQAFQLLSIESLTGFFMAFGWMGLAAVRGFGLPSIVALLLAFFTGMGFLFMTAKLLSLVLQLRSDGDQFHVENVLYKDAQVYVKIPAKGSGKVHLTINGVVHELDAVSETGDEIPSFKAVVVTNIIDSKTVGVSTKSKV